ncbi:MAG: tRNA uridine-5-carboxymethylaminomethyl(34) synthesis GTPase MnmE [Pseudomonadota bacterium]
MAIATAPGQGGVGIVRLSGAGVHAMGAALFSGTLSHRQLSYGVVRDATGAVLDQVMATRFDGPRSFTGEDVVEIHGHGGPVVLGQIVAACQVLGARLARPGEFSERAFLNDKLDLAQAEAIADLISAGSAAAARGALRSLRGAFSARVDDLAEQLLWLRTYVEATLDFPDEEDVDHLATAQFPERLAQARRTLASLLTESARGQQLTEGVQIALVGPPNVGKSSLLNALAAEDRAIVSDVPGTTRDLLEFDLVLGGLPIRVVDTAGLRASEDPVEQEGVRRALARASEIDLLVVVSAPQARLGPEHRQALSGLPQLEVWNKADLPGALEDRAASGVPVSALTGQGVDDLVNAIHQAVGYGADAAPFSARARHIEALESCAGALAAAAGELDAGDGGVLLAEALRAGHDALGGITGRVTPDDLLGEIFSSFCIGK